MCYHVAQKSCVVYLTPTNYTHKENVRAWVSMRCAVAYPGVKLVADD